MKKRTKKILALLLSTAFVVSSLAGCKNTGEETQKAETAKEETAAGGETNQTSGDGAEGEVEITMWNKDVMSPGVQNTAIADEIAKKTGVRINAVNGDAQKFKVLMAGGDLPDIVNSNYGDQGVDVNSLQKSGQLIALDELIDKYAPNIKEKFASAIKYSKEFLSPDGKLYYLPVQIFQSDPDKKVVDRSGSSVAFYTRYDLYKELGSPKIETTDEYLDTLKQMQDAHPQTDTGAKTYAISGWSDWGLWMYTIPYQVMNGTTNWLYGMMYDVVNKEPLSAYYSDAFWDCLKFYNKAYNMGILDPEMFTQKYDNYVDKLKSGQTFVTYANWLYDTANQAYVADGKPEMGFEIIPTGMTYRYGAYAADQPFGWANDYPMAITKNCKNPEKVVQMLDYLFSEEGARLLNSGVEGVHWQTVDGVPQMTQEFHDGLAADQNYKQLQGFNYSKLSGISSNQILSDGYPADLTKSDEELAKLSNPIDKEFIEDSGVQNAVFAGQVTADKIEKGELKIMTEVDLTPSLVAEPSDEIKTAAAQVDEYIKVAVSEVIMASEADFDAKKAEVIKAADAKGYNKVSEEMMKLWKEAQDTAKNFKY